MERRTTTCAGADAVRELTAADYRAIGVAVTQLVATCIRDEPDLIHDAAAGFLSGARTWRKDWTTVMNFVQAVRSLHSNESRKARTRARSVPLHDAELAATAGWPATPSAGLAVQLRLDRLRRCVGGSGSTATARDASTYLMWIAGLLRRGATIDDVRPGTVGRGLGWPSYRVARARRLISRSATGTPCGMALR